MSNRNIEKLEERKQDLEREILRLQSNIDDSIDTVREEIVSKIQPTGIIKKYPLRSLGLSVLAGLVLAGKKKPENSKTNGISSLMGQEMKRVLISRGIALLGDYLDEMFRSRKND